MNQYNALVQKKLGLFTDLEFTSMDYPEIKDKELIVDSLEIARNKFPGSSISLDALCKRFRVDNTRREKHNAILDCELLAKVYINLLEQREPIFQFNSIIEKKDVNLNKIKGYSKKIVNISKEELENHEKFLKSELKKNYY